MINLWKEPLKDFSQDYLSMYPKPFPSNLNDIQKKHYYRVKNVTIIVTQNCQLRCSYCYQHAKNCYNAMSKETARKIVDLLFEEDAVNSEYINEDSAEAIILDFIGGEPLLEIGLVSYFIRYFRKKAILLNHRWAIKYMISFSTNGIAFNDSKVQAFLKKNLYRVSMGITIDGDKELHDACRRFEDGRPSYDIVAKAIKRHEQLFSETTTKLTIAPANLKFLVGAIKNLYENLKMNGVYANCVFEEGWNLKHAAVFYYELKDLANWIIENDVEKHFFCSLFSEALGQSVPETENSNYCGGTGAMLSFTADGRIQPCLRYTDFNLNYRQPELDVGTLEQGIRKAPEHIATAEMLDGITRRSQSTDECFYCPIGLGCATCSGYNYEVNGTPDKRTTFACCMHKARVLANRYYWQKMYEKYHLVKEFKMHCPKDWALEIVPEEEYNMLCNL